MRLRPAQFDDIPRIEVLIGESVRRLQTQEYDEDQREGALGTLFGVDRQLIRDQSYFVVEEDDRLVACGGWSYRKTLFGSDNVAGKSDELLNAAVDAARIRAFFVHPEFARRGLGSQMLEASEQAARDAGFRRLELGSTLTGVPLYERYGFLPLERLELPLANGKTLPIIRMTKTLVD